MSVQNLLILALDETKYQFDQVIKGINEQNADIRSSPKAMCAREILEHLCEATTAFIKYIKNQKHKWGIYKIEDTSIDHLLKTYQKIRQEAANLSRSIDDSLIAFEALKYLTIHESYHIGQLCTLRQFIDSNWNPYTIYNYAAKNKSGNQVEFNLENSHD